MAEPKPRGILSNSQGLQQHASNCSDPTCILPMCINKKLLQLRHSQEFQTVNAGNVSRTLKTLSIEHAGSNCPIPFCMDARVEEFKGAQIDLNDDLEDVIIDKFLPEFSFERRNSSEIPGPLRVWSKVTQRPVKSTPTFPSCLENANGDINMNSTVPFDVLLNHSGPVQTTSSPAYLAPQSCLVQHKDQSSVNEADGKTDSLHRAFEELFPISSASTSATPPLATGSSSFVYKTTTNTWGKVSAPNNSVAKDVPSPSTLGQGQNTGLFHMSQIDHAVQRQKNHSKTCPLSPQEPGTSDDTPQTRNLLIDDGADIDTCNARTQVKARLMHALYSIQRLLMQTKSTEEQQMCIRLLTAVLNEIKVSQGLQ